MITALKRYYWKCLDGQWRRRRFGLKDLKHAHEFRCGRKRCSAVLIHEQPAGKWR